MRPAPRVFGAVGLWLVLEWYGATSQIAWLFLLAAWVIALVVVCAAYAAWNRAGLSLHLAVAGARRSQGSPVDELPQRLLARGPLPEPLFEGDDVDVVVGLDAPRGPRGPAWVGGAIGGRPVHLAAGVVPRAGWRTSHRLESVRRGPIGARGWRIGTSDPLGFFGGSRACVDAEVAVVLPRFSGLGERRQARELEAGMTAPRAGAGNELFGLREYRPGDALRRIHWLSSARRGEIVVREYEPPGKTTLALLLDPVPPTPDHADQVARIAASEAWDCIRDGGLVSLWSPGLEATAPSGDLWGVLEWLARYPYATSGLAGRTASSGEEVVVITASANAEVMQAAEASRQSRGWMVGDADVTADVPLERVGTRWPL